MDAELEGRIKLEVGPDAYSAKLTANQEQLEELVARANTQLPIFAMHPGARVGDPVALHFFEARPAVRGAANRPLPLQSVFQQGCVCVWGGGHRLVNSVAHRKARYKILIRRAWEGNRLFVFCGSRPSLVS